MDKTEFITDKDIYEKKLIFRIEISNFDNTE